MISRNRTVCLAVLFLLCTTSRVHAVDTPGQYSSEVSVTAIDESMPERKQAIFFLAPGPVWGFYYFEYQYALSKRHSINLSLEYANPFYEGNHLGRIWGIYRYKLYDNGGEPLDGLAIAPAIHVAQPFDGETTIGNAFLYLTYQHIWSSGFALQAFGGVGYGVATHESETYEMLYGFNPSWGASVGWAF